MMAAATIGLYFGVTPAQINKALSEYIPQNNRSQLQHTSRNRLIIDAYNANPTSMMAALKNFRDMDVTPKMAILGDMKELGECSLDEHRKVVAFLDEAGIDTVWLVGDQFSATSTSDKHRTFSHVNEVIEAIQKEDISDFYILIKGSNSMKLAQTVPHL